MQETMAVMLDALNNDSARLQRIGVNLANALTPGYQRQMLMVAPAQSADTRFADQVTRGVSASAVDSELPSRTARVVRDARPGSLKATGQTWDLAIASRGYFEVATPQGPAYTRHGQFQLDAGGRLVTAQGWPVMGTEGEVVPGGDVIRIDLAGRLHVGARRVAQIKVVDIDSTARVQHLDAGYLSTATAPPTLPDSQLAMRQGFLENSNVSNSQEMIDLMRTMRHFESLSRLIQGYDDMIGGAIRRLGEP